MKEKSSKQLKQLVQDKYGKIAEQNRELNDTGCCGELCGCNTGESNLMAEDYSQIKGYAPQADLGLGCGLPTEFAHIQEGNTVLDLGSGAGNDAFVARSLTGEKGKVIGIDFTERMIEKARLNSDKLGFNNVEFRFGDIEALPVSTNSVDVVVSNCVFNLVPDKAAAFQETFRVLKAGGHFSISDIVLVGSFPERLRESAELYAGCISGAIDKNEYLTSIRNAGFANITIQKERKITLPQELLATYLTDNELNAYANNEVGIYSVTVYGEKPSLSDAEKSKQKEACCGAESTCC